MEHMLSQPDTMSQPASLPAGKGLAQLSRQDMFKAPAGIGVKMIDRVYQLQPCHGLLRGLGMLQNLPSAVVAHVLAPPPGSTVLDMCAAPGGTPAACKGICRAQAECLPALDKPSCHQCTWIWTQSDSVSLSSLAVSQNVSVDVLCRLQCPCSWCRSHQDSMSTLCKAVGIALPHAAHARLSIKLCPAAVL